MLILSYLKVLQVLVSSSFQLYIFIPRPFFTDKDGTRSCCRDVGFTISILSRSGWIMSDGSGWEVESSEIVCMAWKGPGVECQDL